MESDEIEEEFYVVLDVKDTETDESNGEKEEVKKGETYAVSGLDSSTPFLQVGKKVYSGKWQPIVGTFLLFEETQKALFEDLDEEGNKRTPKIAYTGKTFKKIEFERVELLSKDTKTKKRKNQKEEEGESKQAKTTATQSEGNVNESSEKT